MDSVGNRLIPKIRETMELNKDMEIRATFDNFDFKMLANIILKNHKNSDIHWIVHYLTFERFSSSGLDDSKPIVDDLKSFDNSNYLLDENELALMKSDFVVMVLRVLLEFFPCLQPLKSAIPKHIQHALTNDMSKKSQIISLPIAPFNECKHSDVVQYLEHLQNDLLMPIFASKEEFPSIDDLTPPERLKQTEKILKDKKVPLCGDLLSRERVTGAKKTRAGCNNPTERFDNIVESPALWHMKQAFLGYVWEQLYSTKSARDVGTLYHLRQHFGLVNVKAKVKSNFESANSLMLSATKAYLCSAFQEFAGLDCLQGKPEKIKKLPPNPSTKEMQDYIDTTIGDFFDEYVMVECDVEKALSTQKAQAQQQPRHQNPQQTQHQGHLAQNGLYQQTRTQNPQITQHQVHLTQARQLNPPQNGLYQQPTQQPKQQIKFNTLPKNSTPSGLNAVISPTLQFQKGDIVALLKDKVEANGTAWIAMGKVLNITKANEENLAEVHIAFIVPNQESTCSLEVGKTVIWKAKQMALIQTNVTTAANVIQSDTEPKPDSKKSTPDPPFKDMQDRIMNYGLQILQMGTILMQLHDTEKEGDGERSVRNMKLLMLYFRSRPRGTKYAYEIMRFLTFVKALYTKKMAHRITHGQFINWKGGPGNNVANDLKQEHLVKCNKAILKSLSGNKTLQAVERATKAAYGLKSIATNYDEEGHIAPESTAHTSKSKAEDEKEMINIIDNLKPFAFTAGRKHNHFPKIPKSALDQLDIIKLDTWLGKHKQQLQKSQLSECDNEFSDAEEDNSESSDEEDAGFEF